MKNILIENECKTPYEDLFRTLSSIYDEAFFANSWWLLAVNY